MAGTLDEDFVAEIAEDMNDSDSALDSECGKINIIEITVINLQ